MEKNSYQQSGSNLSQTDRKIYWKADQFGIITHISENVSSLMGYSQKEVIGASVFQMMDLEIGGDSSKRKLKRVIKERKPDIIPVYMKKKNGEQVILDNYLLALLDMSSSKGYKGYLSRQED